MAAENEVERSGVFFRELYWLVVICVVGVAMAAAFLPRHAAPQRALRAFEREVLTRTAVLDRQERELEAAVRSIDDDPFYRMAVYRHVLGVKRNSERFASEVPPAPPAEELPAEELQPPPEFDGPEDFRWPRPEV